MTLAGPQFLFVFLDGVGIGPAIAANPFASSFANPLANPETTPFLNQLLGTNALIATPQSTSAIATPQLCFHPIDATLGIPGRPQSATGQTTLYTGKNAAAFRGKHQSAFAGGSLRQLIEPYGMFRQVLDMGGRATHANCYLPSYFEGIAQRRRRYAVGSLLTLTAGLPFRGLAEYERGEAVYWDITGDIVQRKHGLPARTAAVAAEHLGAIAAQHHLTLFESFLPDFTGHAQDYDQAQAALQRIDAFLEQLIRHRPPNLTLILSSDHGNVEDLSTKQHTLNPVPFLALGPEAPAFTEVKDLSGITPVMLKRLRTYLASTEAPQISQSRARIDPD